MVFVRKPNCTRDSAFGNLQVPLHVLKQNIKNTFKRCEAEASKTARPFTGKYPLTRLRKRLAHAMCLDVIFSKKMIKVVNKNNKTYWERSPVWQVATNVDYRKANRFASLLHEVAMHGFRANIVHDLARLSTNMWTMPMRHFSGLCRKILSKIAGALRALRSSPDPLERFGTLSNNPVVSGRVHRHQPIKRKDDDLSKPRPYTMGALSVMLSMKFHKKLKKSLALQMFT